MSWRLRHRCSRSCEASAGQEQKFGFAGPSSEEPGTDFNQVHDINGFLVSEGHSGCLGENCVRGRGRKQECIREDGGLCLPGGGGGGDTRDWSRAFASIIKIFEQCFPLIVSLL